MQECVLNAKEKRNPTIVVMGLDKDGRPRAAAYPAELLGQAAKAAEAWKLRLGRAENDGALALAQEIPHGEKHNHKKVNAPTIKRETYDLLLKAINCDEKIDETPKTSDAPADQDKYVHLWEVIEVGGTVLWQADPSEGYFPCTVVGVSKDRKLLTLKWRDYPKLPSFQAKRIAVGLIAVIK